MYISGYDISAIFHPIFLKKYNNGNFKINYYL